MTNATRMTVHDINELARKHTHGYILFDQAQVDDMRERLANYGANLSAMRSLVAVMMTQLTRVSDVLATARDGKDFYTSDALRAALDVTYPFETTPRERQDAYDAAMKNMRC